MTEQVITGVLTVVVAIFGSSVIVAVINRRQVKADAARLDSEAGLNDANAARILAETATALLAPTNERLAAQDARIDSLEKTVRRYRRLIRSHLIWDRQAVAALRNAGIELPDPPTLEDVA